MAKSNVGKKPISQEDYTTNKVLTVFSVCLLGVLVLMVLQNLLDRANTWATGMVVVKILLWIGVAGVLWGIFLLVREHTGKRSAERRIICGRNIVIASLLMTAAMAAISYLGILPIKALYVVLPVLAVYYLIYHSYAPEFFLIALDCGVGLGLIWLVYRAEQTSRFGWVAYAAIAAAAVLTVIQILAAVWLRGHKAQFTLRGRKIDLKLSQNAYKMLYLTPVVMTALVAAAVFITMGQMILLGVAAAYFFVTAVYYTVKLM